MRCEIIILCGESMFVDVVSSLSQKFIDIHKLKHKDVQLIDVKSVISKTSYVWNYVPTKQ